VTGGQAAGLWGGAIGFVIGLVLMLAGLWAFDRARDK
jgi:hypothetical protein